MASPGIIAFNGKNDFRVWKKKIKCVLIQQNVYYAITKVFSEKETAAKPVFMNDYAVSTISLNLSDSVLHKVDLIEDAKELWDKLDELFLENSMPNQMHLLDKFFKFSLDLSKGLDENLDVFSKLIHDIKETSNKSIDDYSAFALVNAIPDAYSDVRSAMKYGRDNVTVELVMSNLRTKEIELKQVEGKHEDKVGVLVDMKQYSLALQMLDEMLWRDASIKRSTFNIVMSLFHRMVRLQPPPSVVDFTKFWSGVIKIKQYSVALHLFHQMLRIDAPVNHYTLSIAINCFCCVKRPDFGFAVLGSFFKRGYEPNVVTFNTLLKGLMLVGKIQEAAKLLAEQVCYPDEVTYHTFILS